MGRGLQQGLSDGNISMALVDASIMRILTPMYEFGIFDHAAQWANMSARLSHVTSKAHSALARKIAAAGAVLVKNDGGLLPLAGAALKIAVIGAQAVDPVVHGFGSGGVVPTYVVTPLQGIAQRAGTTAHVTHVNGTDTQAAASAAAAADVAIVVVGDPSAEGSDRATLALSGTQDALVAAVAKAAGHKIVVVCANPGPVLLPWAADVGAVVLVGMAGVEMGHALADVLWGDVNPSGRLPFTLPNRDNEVNFTATQYPGTVVGEQDHRTSVYSEGLLVGYRWYDHHAVEPAYPFGHGLSYTTFQCVARPGKHPPVHTGPCSLVFVGLASPHSPRPRMGAWVRRSRQGRRGHHPPQTPVTQPGRVCWWHPQGTLVWPWTRGG